MDGAVGPPTVSDDPKDFEPTDPGVIARQVAGPSRPPIMVEEDLLPRVDMGAMDCRPETALAIRALPHGSGSVHTARALGAYMLGFERENAERGKRIVALEMSESRLRDEASAHRVELASLRMQLGVLQRYSTVRTILFGFGNLLVGLSLKAMWEGQVGPSVGLGVLGVILLVISWIRIVPSASTPAEK